MLRKQFVKTHLSDLAKAFVYVTQTKNNTFITVTNKKGDVIIKQSGGSFKVKGPKKKKSGNIAERCGYKVAQEALGLGYDRCFLRLESLYGGPIRNAVEGLHKSSMRFTAVQQIRQEAHNGVRISRGKRK